MDKKKIHDAISKALEEKGKKKFKQSVELIINMRGIDFSKSEHRLNLDVFLPKGKGGKDLKVAVVSDEVIASQAKKAGADLTISANEIANYAEPTRLKDLAKNYVLLSQPNLISQIAKHLGQYLGPRGKLPKPITGNIVDLMDRSRKSIRITSKGKYMPIAQAFIGTEVMSVEDLTENAEAVYDSVKNKVTEGNIKNMYVKLTMGKPVRIS